MLNFGNKEFRNIVQQVAKNQCDIEQIKVAKTVLGEFGIEVIGYSETVDGLPDPLTYGGKYGDAYAIGFELPYTYYIFTRPTNVLPEPSWFNIGTFPQPGPKGDTGSTGATGSRGPAGPGIVAFSYAPNTNEGYEVGQLWVNFSTGDVYQLREGVSNYWESVANWIGPRGSQGPQGPQGASIVGPAGPAGPQGPAGPSIIIRGQVASTDDLPDPTLMPAGSSYLVGENPPYELYVVAGASYNTQQWLDTGRYNDFQYIEIDIPVGSTSGTLSEEQLLQLQSSPYNTILCNNEYYRFNDDETESGYLVYTHVGALNVNDIRVKTFVITLSTRGFVINELNVAQEAIEEVVDLVSQGWTDVIVGKFNAMQSIPLTKDWGVNTNVAMFLRGENGLTDGVVLTNLSYSEGLGSYAATFRAITKPEVDLDILLVSIGGER